MTVYRFHYRQDEHRFCDIEADTEAEARRKFDDCDYIFDEFVSAENASVRRVEVRRAGS